MLLGNIMTRNYRTNRHLTFIVAFFITISLVALMPSLALADLPPRPGPPAPNSGSGSDSDKGNPSGGYITLQVPMASRGIWTVVQWQDQAGAWHDVEDWRGMLDDGWQKMWWIDPADFGKGPFRWEVYQDQHGKSLTSSSSFFLPNAAYERVTAEVELLPGQPLPQPNNLPASRLEPTAGVSSPTTASAPDFLPVTGAEPDAVDRSKFALSGGVLLLLIGTAIHVSFKEN